MIANPLETWQEAADKGSEKKRMGVLCPRSVPLRRDEKSMLGGGLKVVMGCLERSFEAKGFGRLASRRPLFQKCVICLLSNKSSLVGWVSSLISSDRLDSWSSHWLVVVRKRFLPPSGQTLIDPSLGENSGERLAELSSGVVGREGRTLARCGG
jgi:hypothetical protein